MRIYINMKQAGSRRNVLAKKPYEIPDDISSLQELLEALVRSEVQAYRERQENGEVLQMLGAEEIQAQAETGKVSFGRIYSDKKIDEEKAVNNAWYAVGLGEEYPEDVTAVPTSEDESTDSNVRKELINGRIYIIKDNKKYDLTGRLIEN